MTPRITTDTETVPVDQLTPHPGNPRRGNVDAIAESLRAHGQYRPIVANRRTGLILAGNHTWRAAKRLGWTKIAVSWVDVDTTEEARIILVDNRASDLATYDDSLLSALLRSLPDLEDSGYNRDDLDALEGLWDEPASLTTTGNDQVDDFGPGDADVTAGPYRLTVDRDPFDAWAVPIEQSTVRPEETIRRRLGLPAKPRPVKVDPESTPVKLSTVSSVTVPINDLTPYPGNARQGDVGAIAESLTTNGQFRPIVVNRSTSEILVGNHTWQAARLLGWSEIAVTFVDVEPDEARRIVLVDNRTTDLATYDPDSLLDLLKSVATDLTGTGFTGDDLDDLLTGADSRPSKPISGDVKIRVERWTLKVTPPVFREWSTGLGDRPHDEIANRLDLPTGSWTTKDTQ
jgi:ParB-like chromosome segregation protein Spo0J